MKKLFVFIMMMLGTALSSQAQQIDSLTLVGWNIPPDVRVQGTFGHTGFKLLRAEGDSIIGDRAYISLVLYRIL